ncbi:hypothetical protein MFIFM68171_05637 [Madurella fahalii]|uniref:DUF7889 domain-containing protein n=1 Tax=Madurella fahalii TaxID=1157608 RepID=A0ABQ0GCD1_9PEZI
MVSAGASERVKASIYVQPRIRQHQNVHVQYLPADDDEWMRPRDTALVYEYLKIYRMAGGDPDKFLRIAKELNIEDKLEYWLKLAFWSVKDGRVKGCC